MGPEYLLLLLLLFPFISNNDGPQGNFQADAAYVQELSNINHRTRDAYEENHRKPIYEPSKHTECYTTDYGMRPVTHCEERTW